MKLILIDDDCLVVSALKMILESEPDLILRWQLQQRTAAQLLHSTADTGRMCF